LLNYYHVTQVYIFDTLVYTDCSYCAYNKYTPTQAFIIIYTKISLSTLTWIYIHILLCTRVFPPV